MADRIVIAGAGVAGLTAALSLAAKGSVVTIFERAAHLQEVGAGLQLSPNATRILRSLGVLEHLERDAVQPQAIVLKDAATLASLARVPLGASAERRWGAPYLVTHRADLQHALLQRICECPAITLITGAEVLGAQFDSGRVAVKIRHDGVERQEFCRFLVGADGVWSRLRSIAGAKESRFSGFVAYRAVLHLGAAGHPAESDIVSRDTVTAFLSPRFHLVAYPLRGGAEINLVAITRGPDMGRRWADDADMALLAAATAAAAPALSALIAQAGRWTAWPLHEAEPSMRWVHPGGLVLIGDAAHALTPYAAQGAAMAIEDAALLAQLTPGTTDIGPALVLFEEVRRSRLARVARRGDFNRFVWHARGPVALARNLVLRWRSEERLAADLDWLYGYDAAAAARPEG